MFNFTKFTNFLVCLAAVVLHVVTADHFTNEWAVRVSGGEDVAKKLAVNHGFEYITKIFGDYYLFRHRRVSKRSLRASEDKHATLLDEPQVLWLAQQVAHKRVKRSSERQFNDPKWPRMWYLNRVNGPHMNVMQAWSRGYTGRGIVVTILDDGIEKDHPDLKRNYDSLASYDVNDHDPDPQPRYDMSNENRHGTRCAGVVAAEANNNICIAGVAFEAGIGGIRMLDGDVSDAVEAESLSYNIHHIHIFSASWGPDDDGKTVDGPGPLARKAFHRGIVEGRGGLGSIYVWASGNGGRDFDSCNCDGYTNSIYTLSISSATENGNVPWYSEACSSTLASTYSSGSGSERQIVTTDLRKSCTETHTGTSASAPLAAGIFALVLQANPRLTWRDLQHLVVLTSRPGNLEAEDWKTNGVGRQVSHHFGYGLLDVGAMITLAQNWTNVPKQHRCEIQSRQVSRGIPINGNVEVSLDFDGCRGTVDEVMYAEHVQAVITLHASRRGEVEIFLTSPAGTRSTLLARRVHDTGTEGFTNWAFLTTHSWGESAIGTWRLEVKNGASVSQLNRWSLVVYGVTTPNIPWQNQLPAHPQWASPELKSQCTDATVVRLETSNASSMHGSILKTSFASCAVIMTMFVIAVLVSL